jgi:diacylglycerol kinase family enzyme
MYFVFPWPGHPDRENGGQTMSTRPQIIAHRGASRAETENTLAAFRRAGLMGADAVELDVRRDVTSLTVRNQRSFPYQLDGDYLGETQKLEFEHVPGCLRLVRTATKG